MLFVKSNTDHARTKLYCVLFIKKSVSHGPVDVFTSNNHVIGSFRNLASISCWT